jgi:hypothetical protein
LKHIVQFSGGASSSYVAYLVAKEHGKENTVLLFHDTKAEHPDAYRFRQEVSDYIGIPITEVSDGRDLWQVIWDHHSLPSHHIPFCTFDLKLTPGEKYLRELCSPFIVYNGFGPDEWRRVQRATARGLHNSRTVKSLLFERSISSSECKRIITEEWGIRLPITYEHLEHNNCIPCFKGGKWHFYQVMRHYPEQFQKAIEAEERIGHTVFQDVSLKELMEIWKNNPPKSTEKAGVQLALPCECWS